jgi:predicted nucleic acid-binding protein
MSRLDRTDALTVFVQDVFIDGDVTALCLEPKDIRHIVRVINQFELDFDDAYQYVVAERNDMVIVSFDHDFDTTERGRKTPAKIVE